METENKELSEEITKLERDKKMVQSASAQLIEEKHQLETSVMQVLAENNQLKAENDQLKSQQKTENNQLKIEVNQLRNQIAAERIQLESHKEEKFHLESCHQREKLLQSEVERLTKELKRITTVSITKKSLVSTMHSYQQYFLIFFQNCLSPI